MGKKKNAKGKAHAPNKNSAQKQAYREAILKSFNTMPEATVDTANASLRGTNELYEYSDRIEQQSVPTAKKLRVWYWIKENAVEILIGCILIGVMGWLCVSTVDLKVKTAEMNVKIEYMQDELASLSESSSEREIIELELKSIKKELESANIFNAKDLEKRIDNIEKAME